MGCDIHFFVERKNKDKWEMVAPERGSKLSYDDINTDPSLSCYEEWFYQWSLGRDYDLFALLTHGRMRGDVSRFIEHDGFNRLPSDISEGLKKFILDPNYHSPMFITLSEFLAFNFKHRWKGEIYGEDEDAELEDCPTCGQLWNSGKKVKKYTYADRFKYFLQVIELMKEMSDNPEHVRAVFAFDS